MRRAWGLHTIVLLAVLAALMLTLWLVVSDAAAGFAVVTAFVWMPVALVYAALSTTIVALLRPGRDRVALAHFISLTLGSFAPLLFLRTGAQ